MAEAPGPEHARLGELLRLPGAPDPAAHTELFLLNAYPYASVYLGAEGMLGGEARDRVAGFWRALGLTPPPEPDHLSALLGLYASLIDRSKEEAKKESGPKEAAGDGSGPAEAALWERGRRALLWEHLLSWLPPYLLKVEELGSDFYQGWACLLRESLLKELTGAETPDRLPLHLREAPALPDSVEASEQPEEFLGALLAPVRSGVLLFRADLARAGRELGLGVRLGERRFILRTLLSQDADSTLEWLATEARAWRVRHRVLEEGPLGPVATFWAERAEAMAALLDRLRQPESGPDV